ncbi:MAG: hypothetical protein DHS20C19_00190 [Acidimicrobiales bacterium]|nr:MAG: hypothetical protein DHS20C19_00190 [Acidimicrobiales bacterium]
MAQGFARVTHRLSPIESAGLMAAGRDSNRSPAMFEGARAAAVLIVIEATLGLGLASIGRGQFVPLLVGLLFVVRLDAAVVHRGQLRERARPRGRERPYLHGVRVARLASSITFELCAAFGAGVLSVVWARGNDSAWIYSLLAGSAMLFLVAHACVAEALSRLRFAPWVDRRHVRGRSIRTHVDRLLRRTGRVSVAVATVVMLAGIVFATSGGIGDRDETATDDGGIEAEQSGDLPAPADADLQTRDAGVAGQGGEAATPEPPGTVDGASSEPPTRAVHAEPWCTAETYDDCCAGIGAHLSSGALVQPGTLPDGTVDADMNFAFFVQAGAIEGGCATSVVSILADGTRIQPYADPTGPSAYLVESPFCGAPSVVLRPRVATLSTLLARASAGSCARQCDQDHPITGDFQVMVVDGNASLSIRREPNADPILLPPAVTAAWIDLLAEDGQIRWPKGQDHVDGVVVYEFAEASATISTAVELNLSSGQADVRDSGPSVFEAISPSYAQQVLSSVCV